MQPRLHLLDLNYNHQLKKYIQPNNDDVDIDSYHTAEDSVDEVVLAQIRMLLDMKKNKLPYLIGFAIGFPKKEGVIDGATNYIVNRTCNYYEKQHQEDYNDYGEE